MALLALAVGAAVAQTYISRMPNHAGYHLVEVHDELQVTPPARPRHVVFILVDGLRLVAAESMRAVAMLRTHGQCRVADQGSYTVSRPMYAVLSTGVEVDRHGSRNNEDTSPLAAESLWEIARADGRTVAGASHLPWFPQLFPRGFDAFHTATAETEDVMNGWPLADVTVLHPLYVDEAAHQHGALSAEHTRAVERADRETLELLAHVDFAQDLVVFTADHGHRDAGGHGGDEPDVARVMLCFAGRHVARVADPPPMQATAVAPTLAVLSGLRFPRHMRAGDDGLDAVWSVVDMGADPRADAAPYLQDRRAAITRFRRENAAALRAKSGGAVDTWPAVSAQRG
jgi:hypothetical protein